MTISNVLVMFNVRFTANFVICYHTQELNFIHYVHNLLRLKEQVKLTCVFEITLVRLV